MDKFFQLFIFTQLFLFSFAINNNTNNNNNNNNATIVDQCLSCIEYGETVFIKSVWFALSTPDYRCISRRFFSTYKGFIVDFTCSSDYCPKIENSPNRFIWNNYTSYDCSKVVDWNQVDISPQTYFLWIQVVLLMVILLFVVIGMV